MPDLATTFPARGRANLRSGGRLLASVEYERGSGRDLLIRPLASTVDLLDYSSPEQIVDVVFEGGANAPGSLEPIFGAAGDLSCFSYRVALHLD